MVKVRKFANGIERFLHGSKGQRFFNFAYSIGAAVVILGALFKILHLPYGSELLIIGMGTEVMMFVLTAFDRPPKEYAWEDVFPVLDSHDPTDRPDFADGLPGQEVEEEGFALEDGDEYLLSDDDQRFAPQPEERQSTLPQLNISEEDTESLRNSIAKMAAASEQLSHMADLTTATTHYLEELSQIASQMEQLKETTRALNEVSAVLLDSYRAITDNSESITNSSTGYIDRMADLNRNIGGLNTIYEIQLKSISSQLDSIDRVNRGLKDIRDMYEKSAHESSRYCEETEKMARYMKQLNQVYEKMITAMTINMYNPMMGGAQQQNPSQPAPFPGSDNNE